MPRPVTLFTGPWADLPLEVLAAKAAEWGYDGLELCCWGDHFEVNRSESEDAYTSARLDLLARHDLQLPVLANHKVGQLVCDDLDKRHQSLAPDHVWGDGKAAGVRQRAAEEMMATFRAAERMGAAVVSGFTGSPIWGAVTGYPAPRPETIADALKQFAKLWNPILDVARDVGVKFAYEVHPGQIAFDLYTAEAALDALGGREEFGFTFDPSHMHWQGLDPVEFLRKFPDRIFHVHVKDAALSLNGRTGLLSGYWPSGDPRRGFQFRSPGRGGVDWEAIVRALHDINYDGPLSVDWHDAGMDREFGAREACEFVKRLDFERAVSGPRAFRG
jgi:sugar phosphate isomerase/epimerase